MLILASKSAARQALLRGTGLAFTVVPASVNERAVDAEAARTGASPEMIASALAVAKAQAVSARHGDDFVIGADQVLALGDDRLHKPADLAGARNQLDRLRGRTHLLHSGIALARGGRRLWSTVATARLTMRSFAPDERDAVLTLEGEGILGSVGAYRLEGPSIRLFERIEGDYFTILGLPLLPLLAALRQEAPELMAGGDA